MRGLARQPGVQLLRLTITPEEERRVAARRSCQCNRSPGGAGPRPRRHRRCVRATRLQNGGQGDTTALLIHPFFSSRRSYPFIRANSQTAVGSSARGGGGGGGDGGCAHWVDPGPTPPSPPCLSSPERRGASRPAIRGGRGVGAAEARVADRRGGEGGIAACGLVSCQGPVT